jgi:hypothetical protein
VSDIELSDETLEQLFAAAGSEYEVPGDAFERVLAAAGETGRPQRGRFQHPRLVAAAALIVVAAGGASIWGGVGHGGATTPTAAGEHARSSINGAPKVVGKGHLDAQSGTTNDYAASPALSGSGSSGTTALSPGAATPAPTQYGTVNGSSDASKRLAIGAAPTGASLGVADGAKIVHTGSLSLTVAKGQVSPVLTKLTNLATGLGGYVSSTSTSESGNQPTGTVVVRVPAGSFDSALAQARTFGTVTASTSKGADVTAKAADQQAQLTSLKRTRDQFLLILAKAKTIGETLSVQQRVDDAQAQIDQVQGQINVLADQSSYGTLTATVTQKAPAVVPTKAKPVQHQSGLSKAWHRAVDGFVTGVEALIARSGRAVLVLIVLVIGLGVLRAAWKVGRRRLV